MIRTNTDRSHLQSASRLETALPTRAPLADLGTMNITMLFAETLLLVALVAAKALPKTKIPVLISVQYVDRHSENEGRYACQTDEVEDKVAESIVKGMHSWSIGTYDAGFIDPPKTKRRILVISKYTPVVIDSHSPRDKTKAELDTEARVPLLLIREKEKVDIKLLPLWIRK